MTRRSIARIEIETIPTPTGTQRRIHLPRRPTWWDSPNSERRRRSTVADFQQSDLVYAIDELRNHTSIPPMSIEEAASVVRRQWTLRWLAELGRAKLPTVRASDESAYWVLYWQQKAADNLADAAWGWLMERPSLLVDSGVRHALASTVEHEISVETEAATYTH